MSPQVVEKQSVVPLSCREKMASRAGRRDLLLLLIIAVVDNVEEAELVDTLGDRDDTEPVTELVLLEELLGTVVAKT